MYLMTPSQSRLIDFSVTAAALFKYCNVKLFAQKRIIRILSDKS